MLSEEGLLAEDWGGDIPMVEVSAKKNINLDACLKLLCLVLVFYTRESGTWCGIQVLATGVAERVQGDILNILATRSCNGVDLCVADVYQVL